MQHRSETADRRHVPRGLNQRIVPGLAALLSVSALLAACGSSESGSGSATTSTAAAGGPGVTVTTSAGATPVCPAVDGSSPRATEFASPPPTCIDPTVQYSAVVQTDRGSFTIDLDATLAPSAVNNFVFLARYHFYDGLDFYRVVPGTMVATGKLAPPDREDPGYRIDEELPDDRNVYVPGAVLMDNDGPNTDSGAFFVLTATEPIAPKFTVFGTVTDGFDTTIAVIEATGNGGGTPTEPTIVESVTITES